MSPEDVKVGDTWRVRLGMLEGERQIVATFGTTVAVCAPTDFRIEYHPWSEIEFLALVKRRGVLV